MIIYYDSRTGNVERFIEKLKKYEENLETIKITKDMIIEKNGHLITYTTGFGSVPKLTKKFLENNENNKKILSVTASGNMNWGKLYGLSANKINKKYNIPIIMKFELAGTFEDVKYYINQIKKEVKNGK